MGRPLNKKYFGNRNIGSTVTTTDDDIGGEGIASIDWSTLGSFTGNSNVAVVAVPALPAPSIPTGVQATWTVQFEVNAVTTGAGKTNLAVGDQFGVGSIPGLIANVTDTSGSNAVFSVTASGASRGNALAVASIPQDTQGITLSKIVGPGTAATFLTDISFRIKESSVTITEKGSGYLGTETFTFTKPGTTTGTVPAGTIVLTADTGGQYAGDNVPTVRGRNVSTYQENSILIYAKTTSGGTSQIGDIVSQKGRSTFKVITADGTADCLLKGSAVSAAGECTITATDSGDFTYYVTKISSHRCTVTQGTGTQFETGQSVPWTFGSAVNGVSVKIPNA